MTELTDKQKERLRKKLEKLLILESREEAYEILTTCDEKWYTLFNEKYRDKNFNIACCVIDTAKDYMIKAGKAEKKDGDHFGGLIPQEDLL